MLYGGGAFVLVLFAAGLGFETLERRRDLLRRMALFFPLWSVVSLLLYLVLAHPPAALFGFAALISVGFAILFVWASRVPRRSRSGALLAGVVLLSLLDVSTLAFWYLRGINGGAVRVEETRFGRSIGDANGATTRLASLFMLRETKALVDAHVPIDRMPLAVGLCAAVIHDGPFTERDVDAAFSGPLAQRVLPVARDPDAEAALAALAPAPLARCEVEVRVRGTYNSLRMQIHAAQPALVFLRDGVSNEWRATLDGRSVPILRAFGAFKAVAVPAGKSELRLRYNPPFVGASLLAAYAVLLLAGFVAHWLAPSPSVPTPRNIVSSGRS
jgi:uncharacterized membrane protein YfhO